MISRPHPSMNSPASAILPRAEPDAAGNSKVSAATDSPVESAGIHMMQFARPEETTRNQARLLIVDDDPDLCDLVHRYLEAEGFGIWIGHSGDEGRQAG